MESRMLHAKYVAVGMLAILVALAAEKHAYG